ncbi:hypothetical protein PUN28_002724 [Cardiocondyla obscurior]|uniref:Uncharacterized protein n=1 Tax=Cardiocondyla obscurior TaxID=286306 RepID=A0AAW2GW26_9HYME
MRKRGKKIKEKKRRKKSQREITKLSRVSCAAFSPFICKGAWHYEIVDGIVFSRTRTRQMRRRNSAEIRSFRCKPGRSHIK